MRRPQKSDDDDCFRWVLCFLPCEAVYERISVNPSMHAAENGGERACDTVSGGRWLGCLHGGRAIRQVKVYLG